LLALTYVGCLVTLSLARAGDVGRSGAVFAAAIGASVAVAATLMAFTHTAVLRSPEDPGT
jgi:hypothetical protein